MANKFKAGDLVQHKTLKEGDNFKGVFVEYRAERGYQFGYFRNDNGKLSGGWFDSSLELQPQLTPAQKLGYKVGDKFVMNRECTFRKGSIITLDRDDGSHNPCFSGRREDTVFNCATGNKPGAFTSLTSITPYKEPLMTPVQKAGYKIGDKFTVLETSCGFSAGQIITLNRDDGSSVPLFKGDNDRYTLADNMKAQGAYFDLNKVEPYVEPKAQFKVGDRVKVIDAGDGFEYSALNKHGVIRRTDSTSLPVLVDFDDGENDWGTFEELMLEADVVVAPVIDIDAINAKLKQIDRLSAEIKELLA